MRIKEIILDGFKSYSTKTVIKSFDPQFNAITGLNGSGKSNILDAICFVLGISALRQIRAEKKSELIYKNGTSGVTKASVTLVFDNSEKEHSPPGYEEHSEIKVAQVIDNKQGGSAKYYINGSKVTQDRVRDFFCSVKLNVNNPHFLIMQGRVTKVINMKPMELLGLIEEAAGTSLFNAKREESQKLIRKKDFKVDEIMNILDSDVNPKLEQLKKDKDHLDSYKAKMETMEHLQKLLIAYSYHENFLLVSGGDDRRSKLKMEIDQGHRRIEELLEKISEFHQSIKSLEKQGAEKKKHVEDLSLAIGKKEVRIHGMKDEIERGLKALRTHKKVENEGHSKMAELMIEEEALKKSVVTTREAETQLKEELNQKRDRLLDSEDHLKKMEEGSTINERQHLQTLIETTKQTIDQSKQQITQFEREFERTQRFFQEEKSKLSQIERFMNNFDLEKMATEKEIENLKSKLKDNDGSEFKQLQDSTSQLQREQRACQEQVQRFGDVRGYVEFFYQLPSHYPNQSKFNHGHIHGRVAKLFKIKQVDKFGLAVQTLAGGRIRNVVVETHLVARDLLHYKALRGHESFIPLNQIKYNVAPRDLVQKIMKLTNGQARLALDVIDFDKKFYPAMASIFGMVFIADNMSTARTIAFENNIKCFNCVTLEGDMYRADGILSGGATKQQPILGKVQQYLEAKEKSQLNAKQLAAAQEKMQTARAKEGERSKIQQEILAKEDYLARIIQNHEGDAQKQVAIAKSKIKTYQQDQIKLKSLITEKKAQLEDQLEEHRQLSKQSEDSSTDTRQFYVDRVTKARHGVEQLSAKIKRMEKDFTNQELQLEQMTVLKAEVEERIKNAEVSQAETEKNLNAMQKALVTQEVALKEEHVQLEMLKQTNEKVLEEVQRTTKKIENLEGEKKEWKEDISKKNGLLQDFALKVDAAKKEMKEHAQEHSWIASEKENFGKKGHAFDFAEVDIHQTRAKVNEMKQDLAEMKKRVNWKVDVMWDDTNEQYQSLIAKKDILLRDKADLLRNIEKLNCEKYKEIEKTWKTVSKYSGEIFSTLLPGAQTKLVLHSPEEGIEKGIEFRVAFGKEWKTSLTPLSGGQRSLLALSLILALLKFQPAPLYILDEIDSALDISHTQNIGLMIKKFFKTSQFIVVSLKPGFFRNANVLYQVQFIDGRSQVNRTALTEK